MVLRSLLIGLFALGAFVVAPNAEAITLNPPIFEFNVSPGDTIEDVIKVFNDGQSRLSIVPETVNFTAKADDEVTGAPDFYDGDVVRTGRELAPWISVADSASSIAPLTRQDFPFTISVPTDASPGSYFGAVILKSGSGAEQGVGLVTGTAALMLVKVEGDVVEDLSLTDFRVDEPFMTHLPADFTYRTVNEGTVHLQPTGEIEIRNMFGKIVAQVPVNPELRSVLPDSARRYLASWGEPLEEGLSEFAAQQKRFALGKYSAELNLRFGTEGETLHATTGFWVFPWILLGVYLLGGIIIILLVRGFFRWYAKKVLEKAGKATK